MDSFFLKAIGLELQSAITGARIGRPWLEDPFRIIFPLTVCGKRMYLYSSCHPSLPVLYLTQEAPSCEEKGHDQTELLIRKYVTGADITEINIPDMERMIIFRLQVDSRHRDFSPEYPKMNLIFEIMGRYANVILTADQSPPPAIDPSSVIKPAVIKPSEAVEPSATNEKILVALRYVPAYKNRYRQILLGHTYRLPPPPKGKMDPQSLTEETFSHLQEAYDGTRPWADFLHQKIAGLDLLVAREICQRARSRSEIQGEKEALWEAFREILDLYRQGTFSPRILHFADGRVRLFSFPLEQRPDQMSCTDQVFQSAGEAARYFERIEQKHGAAKSLQEVLGQKVRAFLERAKARQSALEEDFQRADRAEEQRQKGDIITAHLHQLKKGMDHLEAENFFDSRQSTSITIPLDPLLTPVQNAQAYYKKYAKARKSLDIVLHRLESAQEEVTFLLSMHDKIGAESSLPMLHEYADLLKEKGILQPEGGKFPSSPKRAAERQTAGRAALKDIRRYMSVDGLEILVGKNDRGNDALTCRVAQKDDLWFHTQDVAGSHVLVRNPQRLSQIPFSTILQAASLAAYYSQARKDTKVAVDYAFRKYISKPKGARPGLVLVTQKSSVLVPPQCLKLLLKGEE